MDGDGRVFGVSFDLCSLWRHSAHRFDPTGSALGDMVDAVAVGDDHLLHTTLVKQPLSWSAPADRSGWGCPIGVPLSDTQLAGAHGPARDRRREGRFAVSGYAVPAGDSNEDSFTFQLPQQPRLAPALGMKIVCTEGCRPIDKGLRLCVTPSGQCC